MIRVATDRPFTRKIPGLDPGFTLLEVLVSLVLLAIVLTTVWNLHSQTLSLVPVVRFHSQAPFLAQQKITDLEFLPDLRTAGGRGDFAPDHPEFTWELVVTILDSEAWGEKNMDVFQLDLTIREERSSLAYSVRTYRFQPRGQTGLSAPVPKPGH